jgi:hypothetical protein
MGFQQIQPERLKREMTLIHIKTEMPVKKSGGAEQPPQNGSTPDAAALSFAQEALRRIPGITALSAEYLADTRTVKIAVGYGDARREIEVKL